MNNLNEIMKRENITPVELSKKTGICSGNIRRIMNDKKVIPRYKTCIELSKVLGYSVAQIRGEKEI